MIAREVLGGTAAADPPTSPVPRSARVQRVAGALLILLVIGVGGRNGVSEVDRVVFPPHVSIISYSVLKPTPRRAGSVGQRTRTVVALVKNDSTTLIAADVMIKVVDVGGNDTASSFGLRNLYPLATVALVGELPGLRAIAHVAVHVGHWAKQPGGAANYPTVAWAPVNADHFKVTLINPSLVATSPVRVVAVQFNRNTVPGAVGDLLVAPIPPRGRVTVRVALTGEPSRQGSSAVYEEDLE